MSTTQIGIFGPARISLGSNCTVVHVDSRHDGDHTDMLGLFFGSHTSDTSIDQHDALAAIRAWATELMILADEKIRELERPRPMTGAEIEDLCDADD